MESLVQDRRNLTIYAMSVLCFCYANAMFAMFLLYLL